MGSLAKKGLQQFLTQLQQHALRKKFLSFSTVSLICLISAMDFFLFFCTIFCLVAEKVEESLNITLCRQ